MKINYSAYLFLIILLSSCSVKAQPIKNIEFEGENIYEAELKSGAWITNKIIGLDTTVERYSLTKFVRRKFAGNLTHFSEDFYFRSGHVAPCGNDDFTTAYGAYRFFDTNKVSISIDSIVYRPSMQHSSTTYLEPNDMIFLISKFENSLFLTKQFE